MLFPIEYLRAGSFGTLYLDFWVGNLRLGPDAAVGTGGANFFLGQRTPPGLSPPDPTQVNGVCVTYAALNRTWWHHRNPGIPTLNDAEIDASFNDPDKVAGTIYHEFGHLYRQYRKRREDFPNRPDTEEDGEEFNRELQYWQRINHAGHAAIGGLWDRYREAIGYSRGGGLSQGPGEGFAEAFRKRMQGEAAGGRSLQTEVEQVLDEIGMPTLESVRAARAAISRYLSSTVP